MSIFENRVWKMARIVVYVFLAFLSFYCACYRLPVGLKYAVNLLVFGWAFLSFVIQPDFDKAAFCVRFFCLFVFIYVLIWTWSLAIWISEFQTLSYIIRGSQNILYMVTNILYLCAAVYLFEEETVSYTFIGMVIANTLTFFQVGMSFGFPRLITEYLRLLITFADDTGGAIRQMELHDMVYGWGAMVIYYLIHKEKSKSWQFMGIFFSLLYFTTGFKRIAVPAVAAAVFLYYMLKRLKPRQVWRMASFIALMVGIIAYIYLYTIKSGLFVRTAKELGINLMYRDILYDYFANFFELTPNYLGKGIRFIYAFTTEDPSYTLATTAVHNAFLEFYLEIGFWCWWIWILHEIGGVAHKIQKRFSAECASAMVAMSVYVFLTFLTDNTTFYYPINVMYRMTIMTWCYETMRREHIPNANLRSQQELEDLRMEISIRKEGLKL